MFFFLENELSPSSVPLPDAPPPLPEETGDSKSEQPLQDQELTAEQQQLQQQAQIYQQQRLQMVFKVMFHRFFILEILFFYSFI